MRNEVAHFGFYKASVNVQTRFTGRLASRNSLRTLRTLRALSITITKNTRKEEDRRAARSFVLRNVQTNVAAHVAHRRCAKPRRRGRLIMPRAPRSGATRSGSS